MPAQVKTAVDKAVNEFASARLPLAGRGPRRGRRRLAVPRRAAPVRPATERRQGDHRHRRADGRQGEDGHRRRHRHRPGDRQDARDGHRHPRCRRPRRREARRRRRPKPKSIEDADGFAQVFPEHKFHIVDVLQKRGHIVGHDRRRGERRPRPQEGRLRHRRVGGHRRGARRGVHRAHEPRAVGDHRRHQGEPQDRPADEQLRHLPHLRDAAGAGVRHRWPS